MGSSSFLFFSLYMSLHLINLLLLELHFCTVLCSNYLWTPVHFVLFLFLLVVFMSLYFMLNIFALELFSNACFNHSDPFFIIQIISILAVSWHTIWKPWFGLFLICFILIILFVVVINLLLLCAFVLGWFVLGSSLYLFFLPHGYLHGSFLISFH